jgi:anti-sigma B factor antagonist
MDVTVTDHGCRLSVNGDLDFANAHRFAARIETLVPPVTINLSGLSFVDSSGIDALVSAHRRLGGDLVVEGVPARCWRLFEVTGLDELLGIEPSGREPPHA